MSNKPSPCFIIPTKMLLDLAEKAKEYPPQRDALLNSVLISERLRGYRMAPQALLAAAAPGGKDRTVYNCNHRQSTPPKGNLVRGEADPPVVDITVNEAFDSVGITYDFYQQILNRNSVDGNDLPLKSYVHFGRNFNNAFWDGAEMVFGDGDGLTFIGFASAIDVVAHELTHGVTQYTVPGGLDYVGQSGALNESISDVFGSVVKQWHLGQTVTQADWLIGAGIMAPGVGKALRSMAQPGNTAITWSGDDQPSTMAGYVPGGDVHTNSGIPNHAFYLAAMALGGNSWTQAAPIWYAALPNLTSDATFADAARAPSDAALNLFGPAEQAAVDGAWHQVGVI